jgi:hypothetical protein
VLDVFPPAGGKKLFSVSWEPQRPFVPPRVVCFLHEDWMAALGFAGLEAGRTPARPQSLFI